LTVDGYVAITSAAITFASHATHGAKKRISEDDPMCALRYAQRQNAAKAVIATRQYWYNRGIRN
jgi:hypothetical protein